ncbi:hypothetical protein EG329_009635 [Mollisiaceae sp. DMI_Dod_QoI]|nr:hypothetical protein EG329_009635 [Helotiales sp. DMI_Dod_QoI]
MDWARDQAGVSERDLDKVFRYEEKPATVIRMLAGKTKPEIWSLCGEDEWDDWIDSERPHIDGSASGLVLILAKRTGEPSLPSFGTPKKVHSNDWLKRINEELPERSNVHRNLTFSSLNEKTQTSNLSPGSKSLSGRRSVRTLPFSRRTFQFITTKFYIHSSIARDISRADVPVFSYAEVLMGEPEEPAYPAYVYNCRTTNAWEMDLALTVTYFPHCGLTFAILFGSPLSVEVEIVKRLSSAMAEATHPLLLPGIFAEIERSRHVNVVEATIDELETRIFELDFQSDIEGMSNFEREKRNQDKRSAWLDTTYLRNGLVNWNTQLSKMSAHVDILQSTVFKPRDSVKIIAHSRAESEDTSSDVVVADFASEANLMSSWPEEAADFCDEDINHKEKGANKTQLTSRRDSFQEMACMQDFRTRQQGTKVTTAQQDPEDANEQMRRVGHKIKHRLRDISDEYEEKIRDCTMRVDGMAMATQWAHSEANVEIALATGRESKHMRSIALVTMIFLPGTFFAVRPSEA